MDSDFFIKFLAILSFINGVSLIISDESRRNMIINLKKDSFIISFQGINNRKQAENLKQYLILVKNNDIPKLKEEEFHLTELLNLNVKKLENNKLLIKIDKQKDGENKSYKCQLIKHCTKKETNIFQVLN